ncbi:carboxypeptidase regulatory-like domain-containing protein [uncultured Desulfuromonas sp.]|uniref:carboxypeptidase regulatory-like domain-containing protein n=1 Tax=uncultured Desulfuromonas sp. TaxID=181013 RepID=UPI002AAB6096|nr:carboxypeptidase regulatory-like domain-containing protein [uncultured Desulfuromonas sp.]
MHSRGKNSATTPKKTKNFSLLVILLLSISTLFLFSSTTWANPVEISSGLDWLEANQQPDGFWADTQVTDLHASSEVLTVLALFSSESASTRTGKNWLSTQELLSTDSLARYILATEDISPIDELLNMQSLSGGWGGSADFQENNLDTCLALLALNVTNDSSALDLNSALAFLVQNQNEDGGWGFLPEDGSNLYITALVDITLQKFPQVATLAEAVDNATTYLFGLQNTDGSFGANSLVSETSLAYEALLPVVENLSILDGTVTFIKAEQSIDGSWKQSAFLTALALRALYFSENMPAPPPLPPAGGVISGKVVDYATAQGLDNVTINLDSNPLVSTHTDATGHFILNNVPSGEQSLTISLDSYQTVQVSANVVVNETSTLMDIELVSSFSTGTIEGTITDPSGAPVTDALITVSGSWDGTIMTGSDGHFLFDYVTPGDVMIAVAKEGYALSSTTGKILPRTTLYYSPQLQIGATAINTGTIMGKVIESHFGLPMDHLPEEEGITVSLGDNISIEPDADNEGKFKIEGLQPGIYQVVIGGPAVDGRTFRVAISGGETIDLGTIALDLTVSKMLLKGLITDRLSGTPIENAEVFIEQTMQTGRSDVLGTYAIDNIDHPADLTLKVSAKGYTGRTFYIKTSTYIQQLDVALQPQLFTGTLTGKIVDASLNTPIEGVTLQFIDTPSLSTTTGDDGKFIFETVPSGSHQVLLSHASYSSRTLTTSIAAGVVNDVGSIGLGAYPLSASIQGTVWDADLDMPFADVTIVANDDLQTVTGEDGRYVLDDVPAGPIEVATSTSKPEYFNARYSGNLEEGGVLVFSPKLSTATLSTVDITLQTDKSIYQYGEHVNLNIYLKNTEDIEHSGSLHVQVCDTNDAVIFESTLDKTLTANNSSAQAYEITLPEQMLSGYCRVSAEFTNPSGSLLGSGTTRFGVAISDVSISPELPEQFQAGENTLFFNLANNVFLPVSSGSLEVVLIAPNGENVWSQAQDFSLDLGESLTLEFQMEIPDLKFGNYILKYTQQDETNALQETEIVLPNTVELAAHYDSAFLRAGEMANLFVSLTNSGKFNLNHSESDEVSIAAVVSDAEYSETKVLSSSLDSGNDVEDLLYRFLLPTSLSSGNHVTQVTATLSSGSSVHTTIQLAIPYSLLSLETLEKETYLPEEFIQPVVANNGGTETSAQYALKLYDDNSALLTQETGTLVIPPGTAIPLQLLIPAGTSAGNYHLIVALKDTETGKESSNDFPLVINGSSASLQVETEEYIYLLSEDINSTSIVTNGIMPLEQSTLHLEVVAEDANYLEKTWSSEFDFQQAERSGIDTYEIADAVSLMAFGDNFDDGKWNEDRWRWDHSSEVSPYPPEEQDGTIGVSLPNNPDRNWISSHLRTAQKITGDFEAVVDYDIVSAWNSGGNNHPAGLEFRNDTWKVRVDVWGRSPTYGTIATTGGYSNAGAASTTGRFRITRVGSTYTTYYWRNSTWRRFKTFYNKPAGPTWVRLMCYGQGGRVETLFDNFIVTPHTYPETGTITFKYDSARDDEWGKLSYNAEIPEGTQIQFRTRSADTETALIDAEWSDHISTSGSKITSPKGRWIEVEATLATTDNGITPILHDVTVTKGAEAGESIWETTLPVDALSSEESADFSELVPSVSIAGKFFLRGHIISQSGQVIADASTPFCVVEDGMQLSFSTDKKVYKPGEKILVQGSVRNSTEAYISDTGISINSEVSSESLYWELFDMPAFGHHDFSFTTIAGDEGIFALSGLLLQNGTTLSEFSSQYEIASPQLEAVLEAPETADEEAFLLHLSLNNPGNVELELNVRITDNHNALIDQQTVRIAAGETRSIDSLEKISQDTIFKIEISGDSAVFLEKEVLFIPTVIDKEIDVEVFVDQVSYNPNESATLTSTITSGSIWENLFAEIIITDPQGSTLFSATENISTLSPGQSILLNNYWDTGANTAGNYLVNVQIRDNSGTVVTSASRDLVITSTSDPKVLLNGRISLNKQEILTGEALTSTITVVNAGNIDLDAVTFTIRIVDTADETVISTETIQSSLAKGEAYSEDRPLNVENYSAGDYLVVLSATIDEVEQTLNGAAFRVEGPPTAPALASPTNGAGVTKAQVLLSVSNAVDPNNDKLSYEFEIYQESELTTQAFTATTSSTKDLTQCSVPASLIEGHTYYWRARAHDGLLYGPWMTVASFYILDETPPTLGVVSPVANETYRSGVEVTAHATDAVSGVATVEYSLDSGDWTMMPLTQDDIYSAFWETTYQDDGIHSLVVRAQDGAGNETMGELISFEVLSDSTAPETVLDIADPQYTAGDGMTYLTPESSLTMTATDDQSGVKATYYNFDEDTGWSLYDTAFRLTDLSPGEHSLHFYSVDNAENVETKHNIPITLLDLSVDAKLLHSPRVLVWTEDISRKSCFLKLGHSMEDIRDFVSSSFKTPDEYVSVVTDKDTFRAYFRSGFNNVVMIISQDTPLDANFLREIREAVSFGHIGLLVSSWGNSVHPVFQDAFGLKFTGVVNSGLGSSIFPSFQDMFNFNFADPFDEENELYLYDSVLTQERSAEIHGRILRTKPESGTVVAIVPGEKFCNGLKKISLNYPETLNSGDVVTLSLYKRKFIKLSLIDEEQVSVSSLPLTNINNATSSSDAELTIDEICSEGITLSLSATDTVLDDDYRLSLRIDCADGRVIEDALVTITPCCDLDQQAETSFGPFTVTGTIPNWMQCSEDVPALVLNEYGQGKTVFAAYNIFESALKSGDSVHSAILNHAADYLLSGRNDAEPFGIGLLETAVGISGVDISVTAVETLDEALTPLPLFDLNQSDLAYHLDLRDSEPQSYYYFVRFPNQVGDFTKQTDIFLNLGNEDVLFGSLRQTFSVATDSTLLLSEAMANVTEMQSDHPDSYDALVDILSALQRISALPQSDPGDYSLIIDETLDVLEMVEELPFNSDILHQQLNGFMRIIQTLSLW